MTRDPLKVAVLAYEGLCTFEFGIMVELFGLERPGLAPWYSLDVCALERGPLRAAGGIRIEAPRTLRGLDGAGTIVIPGWRRPLTEVPEVLLRKLRRAHADGARLLSVCSGAYVLAAAGLLDDRRATTHWVYADDFEASYPEVIVDRDVLYVDEGRILTSAGSAAGIDMGLHLIRRDHGADVANRVARRMVVPPHRDGGQRQYIDAPVEHDAEDAALARLQDAVRADIATEHTVESMAGLAHMSARTFARKFRAATGTTPHRWLARERVHRAQTLLETTELTVETVAHRVGFGDAQLLRLHFRRVVGTSPSAYRRTFDRGRRGGDGPQAGRRSRRGGRGAHA